MKNKTLKFFTMLLIGCIPLLIYSVKWNSLVQELQPWAAWFTVIATALSPLIAIQVTRYLDEMKAKKREKFDPSIA